MLVKTWWVFAVKREFNFQNHVIFTYFTLLGAEILMCHVYIILFCCMYTWNTWYLNIFDAMLIKNLYLLKSYILFGRHNWHSE